MVDACEKVSDVAFKNPTVCAVAAPPVVIYHVGFQAHQAVVSALSGLAGKTISYKALCQSLVKDIIHQRMKCNLIDKSRCMNHTLFGFVHEKHFKFARDVAYLPLYLAARLPNSSNGKFAGQLFRAGQCICLVFDSLAFVAFSLPSFKVCPIQHLEAAKFFVGQKLALRRFTIVVVGCIPERMAHLSGMDLSLSCIGKRQDVTSFDGCTAFGRAAYSSRKPIRAGRTP